jgi:hypothetical protein
VFRCYKIDRHLANNVLNDCKELGRLSDLYFFKVFNEIRKRRPVNNFIESSREKNV